MADEAAKRTARKLRLGARIVQVLAVVAGVLLAGPDLVAEYITYEGAEDLQATITLAVVCAAVFVAASWVAKGFARGLVVREAAAAADAGVGDSFVIESRRIGGAFDLCASLVLCGPVAYMLFKYVY